MNKMMDLSSFTVISHMLNTGKLSDKLDTENITMVLAQRIGMIH